MKSRAKTLIFIGIFVACLALVSLVLVLTQPKTDDEDKTTANTTQTIPIVTHERDEVASMKITNASGEYTITQNAKGFTINELEGLKQNTTTMGAAGNCITKINAQALAEENASDMAKYGLEDGNPEASCTVTLKDGSSYTVLYGINAPDGNSVYVRLSDSKDVYVVLANSSRYFYNSKESFISLIIKEEISSDNTAPTIDLLKVERKDLDYDIVFEDDTKNYAIDEVSMASSQVMISPVYAYLDITNSNDIIYGLWGLTAASAVKPFPTESDFEEYGLADPFCTVTLFAELQTYKFRIGNVASYVTDEQGNPTNEPAYYYGYLEGNDCIYTFSAGEVKWASFMPVDILSSMMTSHYIYALDYMDIQLHNGEELNYYFDITGDVDEGELSATLNDKEVDVASFKILYQFILKCPIDALCLEDPAEDAKLLAHIEFARAKGGGDTLDFYDDGSNRVVIKLNGVTSFSQPKSYLDVLTSNLKLFADGATGDDLQMIW